MKREHVKLLIESAPTAEKADELIDTVYKFESVEEKVAFLKGMFGVEIIGHANDRPDEVTYLTMLTAIINS